MTKNALPYERIIFVCTNHRPEEKCCGVFGDEAAKELKDYIASKKLDHRIRISRSGCFGLCGKGPNVLIFPGHIWYCSADREILEEIKRSFIDPLAVS